MIVPLVAEFSACTSAYGKFAPLPPVAAAKTGVTARPTTAPAASNAAAARATTRLEARIDVNTLLPSASSAPWLEPRDRFAGRTGRWAGRNQVERNTLDIYPQYLCIFFGNF